MHFNALIYELIVSGMQYLDGEVRLYETALRDMFIL